MNLDTLEQVRINKDKSFDGQFYFGVITTKIFCRPSCPAPVAKSKNVVYFDNIFQALDQGFVPCYRCRPDIILDYYTGGNPAQNQNVISALNMIYAGYLNSHSVKDLAKMINLSERHLRKLFSDYIGLSPNKIAIYHRALFSKYLVLNSVIPLTQIAFASGYNSVRQFNAAFKKYFNKTPSKLRKSTSGKTDNDSFVLTIPYDNNFSFSVFLEYISPRLIAGVEKIEDKCYWRSFEYENEKGIFQVKDKEEFLEVNIYVDDIRCCMEIYRQVRYIFALEVNIGTIKNHLQNDNIINDSNYTYNFSGIPQAYSVFEFIMRAIVGQQISVKAATTITGRIVERAGIVVEEKKGFYIFPAVDQLMEMDLNGIGLTATRITTIKNVCQAIINGELSLERRQPFESFKEAFCAIKGIGEWTAEYVGMRGLGYTDAFPVTDLGIIKALQPYCENGSRKEMLELAERWRPYRAYAAYILWNRKRRDEQDV